MVPKHAVELLGLVNGFQISRAISVVAELGIADLLRAGPREISDLAGATGMHQRSLYRLLRALAAVGVFHEDSEGRFSLTAMGHYLRGDVIGTRAPWARLVGRDYLWHAWGAMQQGIRTGATAFDQAHGCSVLIAKREGSADT